jgi:hypothetical protein
MITTDKIIEIYCIANGFLKEYEFEIQNRTALTTNELKTRNRASQLSHSEIMTILVGFHYGIFCNFKHYYLFYIK